MKILIGCEFSGIVRDSFILRGHDAISCDLLPTEKPGPHHQCDIRDILYDDWDMAVFHPPCTHLAVSGARHFQKKQREQQEALDFVRMLMGVKYPYCLENPVSVISSRIRKPDQIIQPWMFGHPETKKTCLWLHGLPPLIPTSNVYEEMLSLPPNRKNRVHHMPPSPTRWADRSRTFQGIADAMAAQWGGDKDADGQPG